MNENSPTLQRWVAIGRGKSPGRGTADCDVSNRPFPIKPFQPSLRVSDSPPWLPNAEALGYCHVSLRDKAALAHQSPQPHLSQPNVEFIHRLPCPKSPKPTNRRRLEEKMGTNFWLKQKLLHRRSKIAQSRAYSIVIPAAERHRRAAHGPSPEQHDPGHPRLQSPHGRQGSPLAPGTDHAGIATQADRREKQLANKA